ncbi:lipoyltransferase 1, mitochondrial-like [Sitophilus oryzae]|uniref:Lipoyltransferase 1, mitochondrial-like n=1 Tax=Sitophilus oryzae TaxID=7048 RepID=A0A6J2X395_SITOR|nr:lipoyltransferase 1, mitochondrial-like [Sitophilus oryzae]
MRLLLKIIRRRSIPGCFYSTSSTTVARSIYISKSTDIFTNLALEDWLYKNFNVTNHELLMLWQNEPCVVIGRHQNPWIECNFAQLPYIAGGVKLARRNSGGGTVFHDLGNLNLTFFTTRKNYNRKRNLELISRALKKSFEVNSEVNSREDLCISDFKISGTASKLGRTTAYHHCTLLVSADKDNLSLALKNNLGECTKTNASKSVKSPIMNLTEEKSDITVQEVMTAVILEYGNTNDIKIIESIDDDIFPGVTNIKNEYLSIAWRYEKTPKFQITKSINFAQNQDLVILLTVEHGRVSSVDLRHKNKDLSVSKDFSEMFDSLIGKLFSEEVLSEFDMLLCGLRNSQECKSIVCDS